MSGLDAAFVRAVETALAAHNEQIVVQGRRLVEMARESQRLQGELWANERLTMALALMVVSRIDDPLAACEQLRAMALDVLPVDETAGVDAARDTLERALAKIESAIIRRGQPK